MNPKLIKGPWSAGYSLDDHTTSSTFIGYDQQGHPQFDTTRSELGECLYRLKNKNDQAQVATLATQSANFVVDWGIKLDVVIPVPATKHRTLQPTVAVAKALADKLDIAFDGESVKRTAKAKELKGVFDPAERAKLLKGAYRVVGADLAGKSVLLLDDLYRSGATMAGVAELVKSAGAADVFALALTRTRIRR